MRAPTNDLSHVVSEWERRRDSVLDRVAGRPVVRPAGGRSRIIDAEALGISQSDLSRALAAQKRPRF